MRKKTKIYTPRDDLTEYENFVELTKRIVSVKKSDLDEDDLKKPSEKNVKKHTNKSKEKTIKGLN